jgi:hypothetical protein
VRDSLREALTQPYFWLGLAISAGALAWAARDVHIGDVGDAIASANYLWFLPAIAALLASIYARAMRWEALFHPLRGLRLASLFGALNVGYMLNSLLPLRAGEIGRSYVIGEVEKVNWVRALGTIVVERLLDFLLVFGLLLLLLPFVDEPSWATGPALVLGVAVIGLTVALALAERFRVRVLGLARWAFGALPERLGRRLLDAAQAAFDGFGTLNAPSVLLRALGWSVVAWGLSSLVMYCVLLAFGLDVSYTTPLFVMVAVALSMVVPSSPGYIGVYHAVAIETLTNVFSVDRDAAAAFALVSHAMIYLIPTVLGLAYLWNQPEVWRSVFSRALRRPQPETP